MKVDKAVCTTDTMADVESTLRYETLLSTLVQKKISAIKRDCETKQLEKQKRKQQNCLGALRFRNRTNRSNKIDDNRENINELSEMKTNNPNPSIDGAQLSVAEHADETDVIKKNIIVTHVETPSILGQNDKKKTIDVTSIPVVCDVSMDNLVHYTAADKESIKCELSILNERNPSETNSNQSDKQIHDETNDSLVVETTVIANVHSATGKSIRNFPVNNELMNAKQKEDNKTAMITSTANMEAQALSIKSTNNCQIEATNVESPIKPKTQTISPDTSSVTSLPKATACSPPIDTTIDQDQKHLLRVLEAKSISAQCSPIFPQRQIFNGSTLLSTFKLNKSPIPQRLFSRQNESDENVNGTFNSILIKSSGTNDDRMKDSNCEIDEQYSSEHAFSSKRKNKIFFKKKNKSTKRINDCNETHGFISSFNQLTSNYLPVITSTTTTTATLTPPLVTSTITAAKTASKRASIGSKFNNEIEIIGDNDESFHERRITVSSKSTKQNIQQNGEYRKYSELQLARFMISINHVKR